MNPSRLFIERPIATLLLALGVFLAGLFAFVRLPVSPLPNIDLPTISIQASLPGASPETMAVSVASPLERRLGTIADVTEMTSRSSVGSTRITLQFGMGRNIDGAARDVQAAINAARVDLPANMKSNPTYHKVNPASAPILILALTSETLSRGQLYDSAASILQQSLSQVPGIGEVDLSGSALPAVRVELNPASLFHYRVSLEDVRAALAAANADSPKGGFDVGTQRFQLYTNDQAREAAQYRDLVIAYRNGAALKISDVAQVVDSTESTSNIGMYNGQQAVLVMLYPQPGANIIETIDGVKARLPQLLASLPAGVDVIATNDRSTTIRASLRDTEITLVIAVLLVIAVVFLFLGDARSSLIPTVVVPISIIGTFAAMYFLNFSLDILSLMALTIATGFVVDDAIVVLENIARHIERGVPRFQAALMGAREVGPTVISMSLSLIAVFLPILLMSGIVGRLFREFAVTLAMSILVSLLISLTLTPMMCARLLQPQRTTRSGPPGRMRRFTARVAAANAALSAAYARSLEWSLRHPRLILSILGATIALNLLLYVQIPKGFFPQQDTGRIMGGIQADQNISFTAMQPKFKRLMDIVSADPAVEGAVGFAGGRQVNSGMVIITLKPRSQRSLSADQVIARLRPQLSHLPGVSLFMQSVQDIRAGGRQSDAQYQYTLLGDSSSELYSWSKKLTNALKNSPDLADVNSDLREGALESRVDIDRPTAARLGLTPAQIDNALYDAFGERQVSTIYNALNQYHVVMEVDPKYAQSPQVLSQLYVSTSGSTTGTASTNASTSTTSSSGSGSSASTSSSSSASGSTSAQAAAASARNQAVNAIAAKGKSSASAGSAVSTSTQTMIPLSAFAKLGTGNTPLMVNHQGQFVATTISFNLPPGKSLGQAIATIQRTMAEIGVPGTVQGSTGGTAAAFQQSQSDTPILILAALAAVYIVLGVLYESYVHPLTILSTLPSAGVGALLALMLFNVEFSIISLIGVILLIGIVKKNAILMIDFALDAQKRPGVSAHEAIFEACLLRFRPIMMTTFAAMLGALPLAIGFGEGSEMRRPLGISIVGGLAVSQLLTLYTTPVVFLALERWRERFARRRARRGRTGAAAN